VFEAGNVASDVVHATITDLLHDGLIAELQKEFVSYATSDGRGSQKDRIDRKSGGLFYTVSDESLKQKCLPQSDPSLP
jgi:hypothetical protein